MLILPVLYTFTNFTISRRFPPYWANKCANCWENRFKDTCSYAFYDLIIVGAGPTGLAAAGLIFWSILGIILFSAFKIFVAHRRKSISFEVRNFLILDPLWCHLVNLGFGFYSISIIDYLWGCSSTTTTAATYKSINADGSNIREQPSNQSMHQTNSSNESDQIYVYVYR